MLKICRSYRELNIQQLLEVYSQSLSEESISRFRAEQEYCDYLRENFFSIPNAFYALWDLEGRYVSGLRMEPYQDGFLLYWLETEPQERGKGYGKKLVKSVIEFLFLQESSPVYVHIHKKNTISLALHHACDFVTIQDYGVLLDGTVSYN